MKLDPDQHHFSDLTVLGKRLKWWREKQGFKIAAAAQSLGVSTATWGHWETGHTFPSGEMLFDLCTLTKLPLQLLVCPRMEDCPFYNDGQTSSLDSCCCRHSENTPELQKS